MQSNPAKKVALHAISSKAERPLFKMRTGIQMPVSLTTNGN
jgi:hypothetical protein